MDGGYLLKYDIFLAMLCMALECAGPLQQLYLYAHKIPHVLAAGSVERQANGCLSARAWSSRRFSPMMLLQSNLSEVAVYPRPCFQGEPTWCCCISNYITGFPEENKGV
ncbi:hypothetical protein K1719_044683 [Acacia pycnantha]|nr:hypothetical protein K1719_044683 [Acacia pycnantha]